MDEGFCTDVCVCCCVVIGYRGFMVGISVCQGRMGQSSALFLHPLGHHDAFKSTVWDISIL